MKHYKVLIAVKKCKIPISNKTESQTFKVSQKFCVVASNFKKSSPKSDFWISPAVHRVKYMLTFFETSRALASVWKNPFLSTATLVENVKQGLL